MAALQNWDPSYEDLVDRPKLRLVTQDSLHQGFRQGVPVRVRVAQRKARRQRRQRIALVSAVVVSLAVLALPGSAFGGTNGAGLPGDAALSSQLASGTTYVVQTGDSLQSIATQVNPNNVTLVESLLKHELGSDVVVPGERILIP